MRRLISWFAAHDSKSSSHARRTSWRREQSSGGFETLEVRQLLAAASITPTFTVTNDWTSGYQASLRLDSHQSTSVTPWKLEFDLPANITSMWNGQISSHTGNHYVITGASWNNSIPAGGSVEIGFVASPGGKPPAPQNYLLNGLPLGGSTTPPPVTPSLAITDASLAEGQAGSSNAQFTVSLSAAATTPITVKYATTPGTATAGSDYQAASGTLTFAVGQTQQTINVPVLGDTTVEPDETFFVDLSSASGATIAKPRGTGTIRNDDTPAVNGSFQYQTVDDWGTGFTGQITLRNSTTSPITNWQVAFDFAANITSIWDAKIVSHTGNNYVVQNAGYNSTLAAGASLTFGFGGSPSNVVTAPINWALTSSGGSVSDPSNKTPIAAADAAYTLPGQAVVINVLANDTDPDGDALSVASVGTATHGALVLNADSTITYTPQSGFTGSDTFTYQLRDARGATATCTVSVTVAPATVAPGQIFAPYVDMTLYPKFDMVAAAQTQGLRYFTLAFVVADANKQPAWGGYTEYELGTSFDAQVKSQIAGVRSLGGEVIVSFGGAAGQELAQSITDVATLQRAYQATIDAYGLTHIDFDIEGAAVANPASIDRRNQAIAGLQHAAAAAGRALDVSYTLPVLPTGLTSDGLNVLKSALKYGVNIGVVNVMAMDYGDSAAPNPQGKMGDYAIASANSLFAQLKTLYGTAKTDQQLWSMVGVTPMIGLNDAVTETFDQTEARELMTFAQQKGIGRIAFWSLNRDQQNPAGKINYVDNTSSSLVQQPFEFSQIFRPFTK